MDDEVVAISGRAGMNLIEPRWKLFDNWGQPQTWDSVWAHNVLWHNAMERRFRERSMASAGKTARRIAITQAGRDYLAALRAGQA